jgi:hypothetical protein
LTWPERWPANTLHAQRAHAEYLAGQRGAQSLITVKRNQPGLHAQLAGLLWRHVSVACSMRDKGHGRAERRTLELTAIVARPTFLHAAQDIQIVRRRRPLTGTPRWSTETVYAITSLTIIQRFAGVLSSTSALAFGTTATVNAVYLSSCASAG